MCAYICNLPCKNKFVCIWGYFFLIRKGILLDHNKNISERLALRQS